MVFAETTTNNFLGDNWIFLTSLVVFIAIALLITLIARHQSAKKKQAEESKKLTSDEILVFFGGKDNLVSHSLTGTRLTVVLKDYTKINRDKLKELGVERVLSMADKYILVGKDLTELNEKLNEVK